MVRNGGVLQKLISGSDSLFVSLCLVYNAFIKQNRNPKWCQEHYVNYKALIRAYDVRQQLRKYLKKFQVPLVSANGDPEKILRCLVSGFFPNAARVLPDGSYASLRSNQQVFHMSPNSVLFNRTPHFVIFNEVVQTSKVFMKEVSAIQVEWLFQIAPHFYEYTSSTQKHQAIVRTTQQPSAQIKNRNLF